MSKLKGRKTAGRRPKKSTIGPLDQLRAGMPARDSVTSTDEFRRGKKVFRIIHTEEMDEYDQVPPKTKQKKQI